MILGGPILHWPTPRGAPLLVRPDGQRLVVFAHMFSGRRREGDCHSWFHKLCAEYLPGVTPVMLSADTAIHGTDGNLAYGDALQSLLRLARSGAITASLSGPPCETWSEARHIPAPEEHSGSWPRPLRAGDAPWGLHGLTFAELQQVSMGTLLMLNSMQIEASVLTTGGASLMEHPDFPSDHARACAWRTMVHKRIFGSHPSLQQLRTEQWKYGSAAIKPTQIQILGLSRSARVLHAQGDSTLEKPTTMLGGWDADKKAFRTSVAKEYPEGLCRALVVTLLSGLRDRVRAEGYKEILESQLEERDVQWLHRLAEAGQEVHRAMHLADYQPI